ncbi:MAG: type I methionyl aminopeptidase [Treponemataceae bacterium]
MIRLKNEIQINGIRKSCKLLSSMFTQILPQIKEGMSTFEIDALCVSFIKKNGGTPAWYSQGFPGAACISVNDCVIHGVPSKKQILKKGDIVSIDVGIDLDGYISDCSKTIAIGEVDSQTQKLLDVTKQCLIEGIAACKVGNRIKDISQAVYDVARKANLGVVTDFCGHGVGLSVHEDPQIPNKPGRGANPRIQAGMVLAIEPMINLGTGDVFVDTDSWTVKTADGLYSAHEEHTVAVFSDHTEILTI